MNKEKTYVSAVVYLHNCADETLKYLPRLAEALDKNFEQSEIVLVNDCSSDNTSEIAKKCTGGAFFTMPTTLIDMGAYQGTEACMTTGVDAAIGDFVFEFDSLCAVDDKVIKNAYDTAVSGYDVVNVCPPKNRNFTSGMFYKVLNRFSESQYKLCTDAFRLVSRRAINRVHAISKTPVYRKAAYASSGLKITTVFEPSLELLKGKNKRRVSLATDSLAIYTDIAYRISATISLIMLLIAFAELVYTLVICFGGKPVENLTIAMLLITFGLFGVSLILTLILKYVSLLLRLVFKNKYSLVENIEKL